ncbi:MAG: phosphodiester glycosidase family protein [Treponema sp.]|jgi:hypothetical protein|nr:phosphodiester glycosidase family protein [Treponema sp.]
MSYIRKTSLILLGGFFLIISIISLSCATPPADPAWDSLVSFSTLAAVEPHWRQFAYGVNFLHGKTTIPKLEFWVLQIDLTPPDVLDSDSQTERSDKPTVRIVVRSGATDENGALSTRVSSFVHGNNLLAGINAVPFDVISSREGRPIVNMGLVISGGKLLAPANPRYDALVFYKDGMAAIVSQQEINSIEEIENAVGGFHQILADGRPMQRTLGREERHPRSAAGISDGGEYLYLLVIDGRRADSIGATEEESALLLLSLGCRDGINFDGGGSSTLAMRYPDGKVRAVNTPIHGGIPGIERAVAGCIGIALNPSTGK